MGENKFFSDKKSIEAKILYFHTKTRIFQRRNPVMTLSSTFLFMPMNTVKQL